MILSVTHYNQLRYVIWVGTLYEIGMFFIFLLFYRLRHYHNNEEKNRNPQTQIISNKKYSTDSSDTTLFLGIFEWSFDQKLWGAQFCIDPL